jgi:hypothetical protein
MAETNIKVLKIEVNTSSGKVAIEGLTNGFVKAETAVKRLGQSISATSNKTNNMVDKTGLASATLVELGRTISDSNYGMTAMANNLSQLGTLFTTLIATSGGLVSGFKNLWTAMMGPVGIILAFQVVIKYIEKAAMAANNAKSEFLKLMEAQDELASSTRAYVSELLEANRTEAEREAIFERISVKSSELADIIKNNENNLSDLNDEIERYIEIQSLRARLDNEIANAVKNTSEFEDRLAVLRSNNIEQMKDMLNEGGILPNFVRFMGQSDEEVRASFKQSMDSMYNIGVRAESRIEDIIKKLAELRSARKEETRGNSKRIAEFKKHLIDLTREEQNYRQQSLQNLYTNSQQKLDEEERFEEQDLQLKKFAFIQKQRLRLQNYLDRQRDDNKRKDAILKFNQSVEDAEIKHLETLNQLRRSYANKRREADIKDSSENITRFSDLVRQSTKMQSDYFVRTIAGEENRVTEVVKQTARENQARLDSLKLQKSDLEAAGKSTLAITQEINNQELKIKQDTADGEREINIARIRDNQEVAKAILSGLTSVTNFIDTEFQRQLDIEQNKTTAINNELRKRLDNENMSKDERKSIQDQIAKNDEALRLKQEKIEKKRFQMNKAANIATATINTYLAATDVLAREKLGVVGKIAAMTLVIGSGLLQVAAIARQQFVSSASSAGGAFSGGGLGTGGGTQPPDFNIVGASPSNQLAAAVQGQFQQPVKAYVVSKDVSTAQEMDRNIIGSASLG